MRGPANRPLAGEGGSLRPTVVSNHRDTEGTEESPMVYEAPRQKKFRKSTSAPQKTAMAEGSGARSRGFLRVGGGWGRGAKSRSAAMIASGAAGATVSDDPPARRFGARARGTVETTNARFRRRHRPRPEPGANARGRRPPIHARRRRRARDKGPPCYHLSESSREGQ